MEPAQPSTNVDLDGTQNLGVRLLALVPDIRQWHLEYRFGEGPRRFRAHISGFITSQETAIAGEIYSMPPSVPEDVLNAFDWTGQRIVIGINDGPARTLPQKLERCREPTYIGAGHHQARDERAVRISLPLRDQEVLHLLTLARINPGTEVLHRDDYESLRSPDNHHSWPKQVPGFRKVKVHLSRVESVAAGERQDARFLVDEFVFS